MNEEIQEVHKNIFNVSYFRFMGPVIGGNMLLHIHDE